jgi:O-antigen/teichoic acid export membrane protein
VKLLLNDTAVGLYSVAYKITFAFQFIPMAFVASLYPAFAHLWQIDRQKLSVIFVQASTYLLVLSVPIVALVVATGDIVIPLVYRSEYRDSVMPLIVLMLSLPMLFINFPIGSLLNAIGRQTRQTVHLAIGVVATVGLNVVLIPLFGIVGAAIASLGSTVTVFTLGIIVAHRTVAFDAVQFIATSLWVVSAGALLFVSTIALRYVMPWYGAAVLGSVLYVTLLFVTDILNRRTLQQMRSLVRRSI